VRPHGLHLLRPHRAGGALLGMTRHAAQALGG
jgi:hypothetical protein